MSEVVIRVENLYKEYVLGTVSHGTLYRDLQSWWARMRGKEDPNSIITLHNQAQIERRSGDNPHFLALRDVSFDVKRGDVVGIIGRNGAGKSTLLKILSRVTSPTRGVVKLRGRVASLLEVGTGFHPELTGRENIYLNGTILGMTKKEIDRKFDEIVAFAEIEQFIDTPVKRYSSGMYVRLAFAVAAHLDPEILIVDEVLAVGDVQFQKKCLGKMGDVAKGGRTVLFVSHNMQAVRNLCHDSILIDKGKIVCKGPTEETLAVYNELLRNVTINAETGDDILRHGIGGMRINAVEVQDMAENKRHSFEMGESIRVKISYRILRKVKGLIVCVGLRSSKTREMVTTASYLLSNRSVPVGFEGKVIIDLMDIDLRPGEYPLYVHLSDVSQRDFEALDDFTAPLTIRLGKNKGDVNFDTTRLEGQGYFSLLSRVIVEDKIDKDEGS